MALTSARLWRAKVIATSSFAVSLQQRGSSVWAVTRISRVSAMGSVDASDATGEQVRQASRTDIGGQRTNHQSRATLYNSAPYLPLCGTLARQSTFLHCINAGVETEGQSSAQPRDRPSKPCDEGMRRLGRMSIRLWRAKVSDPGIDACGSTLACRLCASSGSVAPLRSNVAMQSPALWRAKVGGFADDE